MPQPQTVRPAKFPDPIVVFDDGDFAIAAGHWEGEPDLRLAVRWNDLPTPPGYPKLFGNPTWMMLPESKQVSTAILSGLLAANPQGIQKTNLLQVLADL